MQTRFNDRQLARQLALSVLFAAGVAACSTPPPTAELRGARDSIARAEYDGAQQLAPEPFQLAQSKYSSAQTSIRDKEMDRARNLLEEAQADADYAGAVAVVEKTRQTNEQLQGAQLRRSGSKSPAN